MRLPSIRCLCLLLACVLLASCTDAVPPTGPEPLRPAYVPAGSTVPLTVDAPLPLFHTGFVYLERYQSYVDTYHEALEVPAGLFRIDIRVEGLITMTERTGYMAPVTYGPGGAPDLFAPDGPRILSAGHGQVRAVFVTSTGYAPNNWAPPHDIPHDTASVDGSWHVRGPGRLLVTRTQGIAPDSRYWSVEGAQRFSVYLTPVRQAEQQSVFSVRCESVRRGVIGACTASTSDNAPFQVTRWEFTSPPDPGSTESVRVTSETTDRSWRGPLVRSGTVTVKAMVNGREQNASTPLTVIDRDWSGKTAAYSFTEFARGSVPRFRLRTRITWADDLGASDWFPTRTADELQPDFSVDVPSGPNAGFAFFGDNTTIEFYGFFLVNDEAMSSGSGFYLQQPQSASEASTIQGTNYCGRALVTRRMPFLVRDHELYHGEVYARELAVHFPAELARLEALTREDMSELGEAYDAAWNSLNAKAKAASWAVHDDGSRRGLPRPSNSRGPCTLLNEDGQPLGPKPQNEYTR